MCYSILPEIYLQQKPADLKFSFSGSFMKWSKLPEISHIDNSTMLHNRKEWKISRNPFLCLESHYRICVGTKVNLYYHNCSKRTLLLCKSTLYTPRLVIISSRLFSLQYISHGTDIEDFSDNQELLKLVIISFIFMTSTYD